MKYVYKFITKERRLQTMKALSRTWEKLFSIITFAEAGEFESARVIMRDRHQKHDVQVVRKSMRLSAPGVTRK